MLLSIAGWYPTFYIMKKSVKREMKKRMAVSRDHRDCMYFLFTTKEYNDLNWIEKHEFRYNGKMYDVLSEDWYNEGVVLYCYYDQKESWLYDELVSQNEDESRKVKHLKIILKYSAPMYILPAPPQILPLVSHTDYTAGNKTGYRNADLRTKSPPPKMIA